MACQGAQVDLARPSKKHRKRAAIVAPMPPMPPGFALFAPASITPKAAAYVADPNRTPMWIVPTGGNLMYVVVTQSAGATLELHSTDTFPAQWRFLGSYGYSANEQLVTILVPARWVASDGVTQRFFVRATNTPALPPAMLAQKAMLDAQPDSGKTINLKGVTYRMILISPPGAEYPAYRLAKK